MPDVIMKDPAGGEVVVGHPGEQALLVSRGYTVVDRAPQPEQRAVSTLGAPADAPAGDLPAEEKPKAPSRRP